MLQTVPLAIAAGIAGALLQATMLALGPVLGALPWFLSPVPLVAVGLVRGWSATVIACVAGTVAFGGVGLSLAAAGLYLVSDALPAFVIATLALRPAPDVPRPDPSVAEHWYPPGHILAWLMLLPPMLMVALALVAPEHQDGLWGLVRDGIGARLDVMLAAAGGETAPVLEEATRVAVVDSAASILPGALAISWGFRAVVAGVLAQALARKVGPALRPSPAYIALSLPRWYGTVFAVVLLAAVFGSGDVGYVASSVALGLSLPFLLLGFKLVHAVARRTPHPTLLLIAFYVVFLSVSALAIVAMVLAGLVEYSATLRRRAAGRTSEDE
ncbi:DUF2232 domain-containing protein [Rhodospira trueperi]|uniref:Predicted membrane protein n=1 Tax=Rhodospira trueperi TaxID=69960 RepID=A0A1G7BJJ4_9PROT|nr:DUF2232 domain-containing protein [Rhodospira trueperi]SDE27163.1 Predicted membrane protein [Rhodospira trueperi]